jgi:endoglucanase
MNNTMTRRLRFLLPALALLLSVIAAAGAQAAPTDPNGFHLQSTALYVHENAGAAQVTVERTNVSSAAQIRYIALGVGVPCGDTMCTAVSPYDFIGVKGELDFPAGVASMTFSIPIVDHGVFAMPKTIQVSLFGPSPIGLADPSRAVLTILNDDPPVPVAANDPLGTGAAPGADPLAGARFFVDHDSSAAQAARRLPAIWKIANQPGTMRFGSFSGSDVGEAVNRYLTQAQAEEPGTVPMLATYRIVDGHCGHWSDPPADQASYHNFITRFAQGIGDYRAVLFLEEDSLITTPCLSQQGLAVRLNELHDAIDVLTANCPRLVIYQDAGAADAIPAGRMASMLRRAGVAQIQGFFLNSTHFDWTSREIQYGERISHMTGGKHFVVNTGDNGRGPLVPRDRVHHGNEVLCNPPGRGLGPLPTANTGYRNVDAFAWTTNPGESGGRCVPGAPPTGAYWPAYALMLVRNANLSVDRHVRAAAAYRVRGRRSRAHRSPAHRK